MLPPEENAIALVNDVLTPLSEARIPLDDRGLLFGEGLFETLRVEDRQVVALEDHLQRLSLSLGTLGWGPVNTARLRQQIARISAAGSSKASLKIIVTRGRGSRFETDTLSAPSVYLISSPVIPIKAEDQSRPRQGLRMLVLPESRARSGICHKTTGYLENAQALRTARSQGFDDALFCDDQGNVTESTTAAFLWFTSSGTLSAAPQSENCFPSLSVKRLFENWERSQFHGQFHRQIRDLQRKALPLAQAAEACAGAVLLSSVRGARPIAELESAADTSHTKVSLRFDIGRVEVLCEEINALLEGPDRGASSAGG